MVKYRYSVVGFCLKKYGYKMNSVTTNMIATMVLKMLSTFFTMSEEHFVKYFIMGIVYNEIEHTYKSIFCIIDKLAL
ncbi:hypothetical protein [Hathewaya proteolytica]|uniref:hypothetical protein n=1 Tax=Hathewaya proteolytica TaxID=29365 RepID=UPI000934880A|nr:hypothetical protein [Hathewaya proteolytica]